jgi:hypothetical protein
LGFSVFIVLAGLVVVPFPIFHGEDVALLAFFEIKEKLHNAVQPQAMGRWADAAHSNRILSHQVRFLPPLLVKLAERYGC